MDDNQPENLSDINIPESPLSRPEMHIANETKIPIEQLTATISQKIRHGTAYVVLNPKDQVLYVVVLTGFMVIVEDSTGHHPDMMFRLSSYTNTEFEHEGGVIYFMTDPTRISFHPEFRCVAQVFVKVTNDIVRAYYFYPDGTYNYDDLRSSEMLKPS